MPLSNGWICIMKLRRSYPYGRALRADTTFHGRLIRWWKVGVWDRLLNAISAVRDDDIR